MDLGLTDRVYLVTGGSKGLGYATAEALVGEGARVVLSSRSPEHVAAAVERLGERARGLAVDNADPNAPDQLVALAHSAFGRLDGLLLSVGGPPASGVMDSDDEAWRAAFDSVFLGALRLMRRVGAELDEGGAIALVLSTSARMPIPGLAVSNGLRPGLAMVAKTLADELGPRGVRVLSLLPGRIATERGLTLGLGDPQAAKAAVEAVPLRRLGQPEEFGRTAAFLLSPAASYLTGTTVAIDGGLIRGL